MSEYYRPANFDGGVTSEIIDNKIVISFPDYYTNEGKQEFIDALKKMLKKSDAAVVWERKHKNGNTCN